MGVLDAILSVKRDEVTVLHQPATSDALHKAAIEAPPARGFAAELRRSDGSLAVIAELKRRSPSKGDLAVDLDVPATARAYARGGAAALSVLTDRHYFGGSVEDLREARDVAELPVLRKDFTIDPIQVYETRGIGADALLLIVAALPDNGLLGDLIRLASELGLAALVETHNEAEIERALHAGATIVGVNSRSLQSFEEDIGVALRCVRYLPAEVVAVAESAVRSPSSAHQLAAVGYDAVLVGEALVRAADPEHLVAEMTAVHVEPRS